MNVISNHFDCKCVWSPVQWKGLRNKIFAWTLSHVDVNEETLPKLPRWWNFFCLETIHQVSALSMEASKPLRNLQGRRHVGYGMRPTKSSTLFLSKPCNRFVCCCCCFQRISDASGNFDLVATVNVCDVWWGRSMLNPCKRSIAALVLDHFYVWTEHGISSYWYAVHKGFIGCPHGFAQNGKQTNQRSRHSPSKSKDPELVGPSVQGYTDGNHLWGRKSSRKNP